MNAEQGSVVQRLEEQAALRFVRWDRALWHQVLQGPAARLSSGLTGAEGDALLESYLRLACEGIGLGLLVPTGDAETWLTRAWMRLVPDLLPAAPAARRAELLAACWNLGENLEKSPPWLQRIFLTRTGALTSLDGLEALVNDVSRAVLEPPTEALGTTHRVEWIHLGGEDWRFLPGAVGFVAPTVVCVLDRSRSGAPGRPPVTQGVWLSDPPVLLGPMGDPGALETGTDLPWPPIADPRFTAVHGWARNRWRAAATLRTSQYLVVALPA